MLTSRTARRWLARSGTRANGSEREAKPIPPSSKSSETEGLETFGDEQHKKEGIGSLAPDLQAMLNSNNLDARYKTSEGDRFAEEELLPVVRRYLQTYAPKILEIGCGYGRNLLALSHIVNSEVFGCDISSEQLQKTQDKMKENGVTNVKTVLQTAADKLPFENNSFDFIVLWQVLEHILSREEKKKILEEATRVVKNDGHILIETPNLLFPFDYHDNNLPLVHWLLPDSLRQTLTKKIRGRDFPPSQYTSIYQIRKTLEKSSYTQSCKQQTRIYFEERYTDIFRHLGGTRIKFKFIFFLLYAPVYALFKLIGLPGDTFTPSIRTVFKIIKPL
jgi:ubiquinone/menaquinone biosynthesis C-methylase UbiE